jgi:hypothetical protein
MEAITFAWERIKADPATILATIGCGLLLMWTSSWAANAIANMVTFAGSFTRHHGAAAGAPPFDAFAPLQFALTGLAQLVSTVVYSFFYVGITRFALNVARGNAYAFNDLFDVGGAFVPALIANVLYGIAVALGTIFLVVPGVILALGLSFAVPLIVDRKLGAIEALNASWKLTEGHKLNIFVLWAICFAISIAGACACGVGLLVSMPVVIIAMNYVYLRLTRQQVASPVQSAF